MVSSIAAILVQLLGFYKRLILVRVIVCVKCANLVVKKAVKIIEERTYCISRAIKPFPPETLLIASVSNDIVCIARKINSSVNITRYRVYLPVFLSKLAVKFNLNDLALMRVRYRLQMLKSYRV